MVKLQNELASVLTGHFDLGSHPRPKAQDFTTSKFHSEINRIYSLLNGQLDNYPVAVGKFDVELEKYIIELDEEQHFNRYRNLTLGSSIYKNCNSFSISEYSAYCINKEDGCLRKAGRGGYWTSPSSERQFGKSSEIGNFKGNGSARWKQRAFYDFLKDAGQQILGYNLFRISLYERIKDKSVGEILKNKNSDFYSEIVNKVEKQLAKE